MTMTKMFNPMNLMITENVKHVNVLADYKTGSLEESYFSATLNFLAESRREFNEGNRIFYKAIMESEGNQIAIHESFSDFFDYVKKIIDKIIEFIKSLFNKFITALMMAIKNEKYLIKHKEDFSKFSSNHEFKFNGYKFSFDPSIPSLVVIENFADSIKEFNITNLSGDKTKIVTTMKAKYDALIADLEDRVYDVARAKTIGKGDKDTIYQSDYANELFTLFRSDANSKEDIDVTSTIVSEAYIRFEGSKKLESSIKKDKDRIEKEYKVIKKQIESAAKRTADGKSINVAIGDGNTTTSLAFDKDVLSIIDLFIKAKANQIQEYSNIHALAFAAKLDAISDCFKQDKTLLYQALYKIQGMKKEAN